MNIPVSNAMPEKPLASIKRKVIVNFGLFGIFFIFYLGAAIIQTPLFNDIAVLPVMGMPFGLLISLAIFPVSWIIIIIWFWKAR